MKSLQEKLAKIKKFDLNGYKKECDIGNGTYGLITLAKKENDKIAIKSFNKSEGNKNTEELIEREIKNLTKCSKFDKLIIGFKGISFTDLNNNPADYPLLILDYASNNSLFKLLKNEPQKLTISEMMILIYGIAKAMEFVHFNRIVHRDLKPGNILLDENYYPLLADFGTSRTFDINSINDVTCDTGTMIYDAPEVLDGSINENNCSKADVFAYGMLVYQILTGKKPYEGYLKNLTSIAIVDFLNTKRFKLPKTIPFYFRQLITLLWAQNPCERPSFSDIIEIYDAGIILPEIYKDQKLKDEYCQYLDYLDVDQIKIEEERLVTLQNKFSRSDNSAKLSVVVTIFIADILDKPEAQLKVGRDLIDGVLIDFDRTLAFDYITLSATKNIVDAYYYLGISYKYGIGCTQDKKLGNRFIMQSENNGCKLANHYLTEKEAYKGVDKINAPLAIIIGSYVTGKTTFINKIRDIQNNSLPLPTITYKDTLLRCEDDNKNKFFIRFRDTGGMEKFGSLVQNYSRGARLAVIMFDLNKRETFERIGTWIDMLHQNEQDNPIIYDMKHVIIGNKSDLKRFVSLQDASEKAKQYNAEYFEVSSLTGDGILLPLAYIENYFKNIEKNKNYQVESVNLNEPINDKKTSCSKC